MEEEEGERVSWDSNNPLCEVEIAGFGVRSRKKRGS